LAQSIEPVHSKKLLIIIGHSGGAAHATSISRTKAGLFFATIAESGEIHGVCMVAITIYRRFGNVKSEFFILNIPDALAISLGAALEGA
jgi:hypothetical protein